jgi:threonine aldolase
MTIDLRSDTVTKPTSAMKEAMLVAPVGDDVFDEDPTVNRLQSLAAHMFGKEAALFCPSGTMTNQIAIKSHTSPGDEVICEEGSHVHYYEGGGIAVNSQCSTRTIVGTRGVFNADQVRKVLRPANIHFPRTSLITLENSCNRGGGKIFPFETIKEIRSLCFEYGLKMHLDGARLFNALVETGTSPAEIGIQFDSVSICLSKGLGAPIGSLLLGNMEFIERSKRIRKVFGGGMRQAGIVAAAGIYALENHVSRLQDDHLISKQIEELLIDSEHVLHVLPVETNIVVFELKSHVGAHHFLAYLKARKILAFQVGPNHVRFVTHLDLPSDTVTRLKESLRTYSPSSFID